MITALNVAADGSFPSIDGVSNMGGFKTLIASGNFGAGTLLLECKYEGITDWVNADNGDSTAQLTVDGAINMTLREGALYRIRLSGATGADLSFGLK